MKKEIVKWMDAIIGNALKSVYYELDESIDRVVLQRTVESLKTKYIESLSEGIKYIHLPYMANERLLAELFVELYAFTTTKKYRMRSNKRKFDDRIVNTKNILDIKKNIVVLGEPGAGKTTFLRRLVYSVCTGEDSEYFGQRKKLLPILIECRGNKIKNAIENHQSRINSRSFKAKELRRDGRTDDYIDRKLPKIPHPIILSMVEELNEYGFPYAEQFVKRMLIDGSIMLFIDGLDEAKIKHRPIICEGLEYIQKHYPKNHSLLTCRTAEDEFLPKGFRVFEITPLKEKQKIRFVSLWFSEDEDEIPLFLEKVVSTPIWEISDRPLLLTLLCALYDSGGDIPIYKVDLYKECAELALKKWDAIRRVKRQTVFIGLSINQKLDILSKVASDLMLNNETQINQNDLLQLLRIAMEESSIEGTPNDFLDEMVSHSGLIQQIALNTYSFSHKSLQEYFAARYFSKSDPFFPISKLQNDKSWLVTTEMTACMVPDATSIIMSITNRLKTKGTDGFINLTSAIDLIYSNPIRISFKGRKKIIGKILHNIRGFAKKFYKVVIIDNNYVKEFNANEFSNKAYIKISIVTNLTVIIYYKSDNIDINKYPMKAVGLALGLIFRVLQFAPTLIKELMKNEAEVWMDCLLNSVLIQSVKYQNIDSISSNLSLDGDKLIETIQFC
jgi:predicted NACHT family NTPase